MSSHRIGRLVVAVACILMGTTLASASDWPRFRGPNGTGISADKEVPVKWSDKEVLWKVEIPGVGHSSPIVWGQRVFLESSSADGKERRLYCLNEADGKVVWSASISGVRAHTHKLNSMASSTPATDGERIYVLFWDGNEVTAHAYDYQGKHVWQQSLGSFTSQHGPGTSPMIVGDRIIIANDQDGASTLYALNAKTGQIAWKMPRKAFRTCYSTPFLLEQPGRPTELIVTSTAGITSYKPATGEENWNWTWHFSGMALRTVGSAIFSQGLIFLGSGDGSGARHTVAVRPGTHGEIDGTNLIWQNNKKLAFPYVPSFLAWGDYLFFVNDKGFAACHEAKTGKEVWNKRLATVDFYGSPILVNGNIYAVSSDGNVYVFPAAPKFTLLAKNSIDEKIMTTPAEADNKLFIRGDKHLFCIGRAPAK